MKFFRFIIFLFLLLNIANSKKFKKTKNTNKLQLPSCDVLEDNLCCCYSNQKYYYWSANHDGFCFNDNIDISCNEDTLKKKSECLFKSLFCYYDETQIYDFR